MKLLAKQQWCLLVLVLARGNNSAVYLSKCSYVETTVVFTCPNACAWFYVTTNKTGNFMSVNAAKCDGEIRVLNAFLIDVSFQECCCCCFINSGKREVAVDRHAARRQS